MPRVLKQLALDEQVKNRRLLDTWPDIVGPNIARHAWLVGFEKRCLFVTVDSPVWHGQLHLLKDKILAKIRAQGFTFNDIMMNLGAPPAPKEPKQ